ncbi:MAG: questin oxidase family protein, partial [Haloechinothrix sp.]
MAADDLLCEALDRLRGTGVEHDGYLANHGPMGAEALVQLGAADQAPDWVLRYRRAKQLEPAPPTDQPFHGDEWRLATGDMRQLGQWMATLRRELAEAPWTTVLVRWWPRLLPGLAASATHGVIRTAHAVRSLAAAGPDPNPLLVDELAQGLAFWGARYQPLPGTPTLTGEDPAGVALA